MDTREELKREIHRLRNEAQLLLCLGAIQKSADLTKRGKDLQWLADFKTRQLPKDVV